MAAGAHAAEAAAELCKPDVVQSAAQSCGAAAELSGSPAEDGQSPSSCEPLAWPGPRKLLAPRQPGPQEPQAPEHRQLSWRSLALLQLELPQPALLARVRSQAEQAEPQLPSQSLPGRRPGQRTQKRT